MSLHRFFCPASILGLRCCPGSHSSQTPPGISCHLVTPLNPHGHPMRWDLCYHPVVHMRKQTHELWKLPKACKWKHHALLTPVTRLGCLRFSLEALGKKPKCRKWCTWIWISCHLSPPWLCKCTELCFSLYLWNGVPGWWIFCEWMHIKHLLPGLAHRKHTVNVICWYCSDSINSHNCITLQN